MTHILGAQLIMEGAVGEYSSMVEGPRMTSPILVSGLEQERAGVRVQSLELYWCLCEEGFNFILISFDLMKSIQKYIFK